MLKQFWIFFGVIFGIITCREHIKNRNEIMRSNINLGMWKINYNIALTLCKVGKFVYSADSLYLISLQSKTEKLFACNKIHTSTAP